MLYGSISQKNSILKKLQKISQNSCARIHSLL